MSIDNRKSTLVLSLEGIENLLGATWDGAGVHFALYSENATAVELCLFDDPMDGIASAKVPLKSRTDGVWLPGITIPRWPR